MNLARFTIALPLALIAFSSGCSIGPSVWTADTTEEIRLDDANLTHLAVLTHNGAIDHTTSADSALIAVATKRGGGATAEDAEDALDAIEVYTEQTGPGAKKIAWRWRTPRKTSWGALVAFKITAPARLNLDATTHNGAITVRGVAADVLLESHNGRIDVDSSGGLLDAQTHNGAIDARYLGRNLQLETHNGRIIADLSACTDIAGELETHNGAITVSLNPNLHSSLVCETNNGAISADLSFEGKTVLTSRKRLEVQGGPTVLTAATHNGSIQVRGPLNDSAASQ